MAEYGAIEPGSFEAQVLGILREVSTRQSEQAGLIADMRDEFRGAITDMRQSLSRTAPMAALDRVEASALSRIESIEQRQDRIEVRQDERNERDRWFFRAVALAVIVLMVILLAMLLGTGIYLLLHSLANPIAPLP